MRGVLEKLHMIYVTFCNVFISSHVTSFPKTKQCYVFLM